MQPSEADARRTKATLDLARSPEGARCVQGGLACKYEKTTRLRLDLGDVLLQLFGLEQRVALLRHDLHAPPALLSAGQTQTFKETEVKTNLRKLDVVVVELLLHNLLEHLERKHLCRLQRHRL